MNATPSRGFTLVELMIGIAVLAILLSIAVPSFREIMRTNRAAAQTNDVVTALKFAQNQASTIAADPVSVCPLNASANGCSGGTDWNTGILVFNDTSGTTGAFDGTDAEIQRWSAYQGDLTATGPTSVTFIRTSAAAAATLDIYEAGCIGDNKRRVSVAITGRIGLTKEAC